MKATAIALVLVITLTGCEQEKAVVEPDIHATRPLYITSDGEDSCFESEHGIPASLFGNNGLVTREIETISVDGKSMVVIGTWQDGTVTSFYIFKSNKACELAVRYKPSELAEAVEAVRAEGQWWVADSSFRECFSSGGPAVKLDEIAKLDDDIGVRTPVRTQDFYGDKGKLRKVEVIITRRDHEGVTTYYKKQGDCVNEQVKQTSNMANRYR